jgi:hypothetical protein
VGRRQSCCGTTLRDLSFRIRPGSRVQLSPYQRTAGTAGVGPNLRTADFAHAGKEEAGTFASSDNNIEIIGAAIRSTAPARSEGGVSWSIEWRAPDEVTLPIVFYIAATAANDDGSPFGDTIHYRSYSFTAD